MQQPGRQTSPIILRKLGRLRCDFFQFHEVKDTRENVLPVGFEWERSDIRSRVILAHTLPPSPIVLKHLGDQDDLLKGSKSTDETDETGFVSFGRLFTHLSGVSRED